MAGAVEEDVKVLGVTVSPFVIRVLIVLRLKRVAYEFVEVDFLEPKSEILVKYNPVYKKIPVLLHRGKPICESAVIVQYIDEEWSSGGGSSSIFPADPFERAVARFWTVYIDDELPYLIRVLKAPETEAAKATELVGQFHQVLGRLEAALAECSKGKGFFGGDAIGYLDIALGSYLGLIGALEKVRSVKILDAEKLPRLAGWAERFLAEESVKGLVPDVDEHLKFHAALVARMSAAPV